MEHGPAGVHGAPAAVGGTQVPRIAEPGTAAKNATFAVPATCPRTSITRWPGRPEVGLGERLAALDLLRECLVVCSHLIAPMPAVLDQLRDVAVHVMKAKPVRIIETYWNRSRADVVGAARIETIPPEIFRGAAAARRVLPLRLGQ